MEYWSIGVMTKGFMSFFQHAILHHSKAETFKNFWQPVNYPSISHNSVCSKDETRIH
jgi:hypothetical protein